MPQIVCCFAAMFLHGYEYKPPAIIGTELYS